jgi:hypothetical protein
MLPKNYRWRETARVHFAAFERRSIVSMIDGCKPGINGGKRTSKLRLMHGYRIFSRRCMDWCEFQLGCSILSAAEEEA